jgi:hypothetical protein
LSDWRGKAIAGGDAGGLQISVEEMPVLFLLIKGEPIHQVFHHQVGKV